MNNKNENSLAKLPPLAIGRITRIVFGNATLVMALLLGQTTLGLFGLICLVFLGLSFLVSGLMSNPGCELSALFNVFLPPSKRMHFT